MRVTFRNKVYTLGNEVDTSQDIEEGFFFNQVIEIGIIEWYFVYFRINYLDESKADWEELIYNLSDKADIITHFSDYSPVTGYYKSNMGESYYYYANSLSDILNKL
jgi:hypothetical protein